MNHTRFYLLPLIYVTPELGYPANWIYRPLNFNAPILAPASGL